MAADPVDYGDQRVESAAPVWIAKFLDGMRCGIMNTGSQARGRHDNARSGYLRSSLRADRTRGAWDGGVARCGKDLRRSRSNDEGDVSSLNVAVQTEALRIQRLKAWCGASFRGFNSLYLKPKTLDEAVSLLASPGGQVLAGGTDFYPALGERLPQGRVVDITMVGEIRGISIETGHVRIGGLATWTEIVGASLPRCFDALKSAAREVGSVQIQNRGTVAGNLCNASPAADGAPPLLALDAEVELVSAAGRRRMPLEHFLVGNRKTALRPDEILAAVLVPRRLEKAASAFVKLGGRRYLVISISMVAAVVQADEAGLVTEVHVAVGSCSARAQRLRDLEQNLVGLPALAGIGAAVKSEHLKSLSPIDDVRATSAYRYDASLTLVQRALEACVGNR